MKYLKIGILSVATVVLAATAVKTNKKQAEEEGTTAALREDLEHAQSELAAQRKQSANLENSLLETRGESAAKGMEAAQLKLALTNAQHMTNRLAGMFRSKQMRDMITAQKRVALGPLMEKKYAGFVSAMGLKSEQAATLKDFLVQKSLIDAQSAASILSGELNGTQRKEMLQQAKGDKDAINVQVKQLLGNDTYSQFQEYEKTLPERMVVSTFKDQLASGSSALTPDQEGSLVNAITEERRNFNFSTEFQDTSKYDYNELGSMFTDDKINAFEQELAELDKRYLTRAQQILTPEQMEPFQQFLNNQKGVQEAQVRMIKEMVKN